MIWIKKILKSRNFWRKLRFRKIMTRQINRIEELKFAYLGIANAAKPARKIKGKRTTPVSRPTLTSGGSSSHAKRKGGFKSRIITDWTRHGIFYAQAITVTPVQGSPRIHTGGPGEPNGVGKGDD